MQDSIADTSSFLYLTQLSREDSLAELLDGCGFDIPDEFLEKEYYTTTDEPNVVSESSATEEATIVPMEVSFAPTPCHYQDVPFDGPALIDPSETEDLIDSESYSTTETSPAIFETLMPIYSNLEGRVSGTCSAYCSSGYSSRDHVYQTLHEPAQDSVSFGVLYPIPETLKEGRVSSDEQSLDNTTTTDNEDDRLVPFDQVLSTNRQLQIQTETYYEVPTDKRTYFTPTEDDVLLGRGKGIWKWKGNLRFLHIKKTFQKIYNYKGIDKTDHDKKKAVIEALYFKTRERGRFLKRDDNGWYEVSTRKARDKCSQALREEYTREKYRQKRLKYNKNGKRN